MWLYVVLGSYMPPSTLTCILPMFPIACHSSQLDRFTDKDLYINTPTIVIN